jgi:hypothetical protein
VKAGGLRWKYVLRQTIRVLSLFLTSYGEYHPQFQRVRETFTGYCQSVIGCCRVRLVLSRRDNVKPRTALALAVVAGLSLLWCARG